MAQEQEQKIYINNNKKGKKIIMISYLFIIPWFLITIWSTQKPEQMGAWIVLLLIGFGIWTVGKIINWYHNG